jgi:hypothetical protein
MIDFSEAVLGFHAMNFDYSIWSARVLLRLHDEEKARNRDNPPSELEGVIRSAIILSVTAWEAFIEDVLQAAFRHRLSAADTPQRVEGTFRAVAEWWLSQGGKDKPKPADLMRWAGDGWKEVLTNRFNDEIARLNTPDTQNIRELSRKWLGWDLTSCWEWESVSIASACSRLDALIDRRGKLVHRPKDMFDFADKGALRKEAEDAVELVDQLKTRSVEGLLAHA